MRIDDDADEVIRKFLTTEHGGYGGHEALGDIEWFKIKYASQLHKSIPAHGLLPK